MSDDQNAPKPEESSPIPFAHKDDSTDSVNDSNSNSTFEPWDSSDSSNSSKVDDSFSPETPNSEATRSDLFENSSETLPDFNSSDQNHQENIGNYSSQSNYEGQNTATSGSEAPYAQTQGAAPQYPSSNGYNSNPYNNGGYPQNQPMNGYQQPYSQDIVEGNQHATHSLIFGILSLFIAGIVFGPLAVWKASKAEKLGVASTPGKVLGWIGIAFAILWLVWVAFILVATFAAAGSGASEMSNMSFQYGNSDFMDS